LKRALTFLSIFLLAAAIVFGIIFGFGWNAFDTLFSNKKGLAEGSEWIEKTFSLKGLTEYIGENPQHVSVVSFNVEEPDSGIYYQAETLRTLGAMQNLFLLLEYERQVEAGLIDPTVLVDPDDIQAFTLPQISTDLHNEVMKDLLQEDQDYVVLDSLVVSILENNDLAAADWLWFLLGEEGIQNLMNELELEHTDTPQPFLGLYISIHPDVVSFKDGETTPAEYAEEYLRDNVWTLRVQEAFNENRLNMTFMEERDALARFPQTQPLELARLMARIYREEVLSPAICRRVKDKLGWAEESDKIRASFKDYGAIYDNRMAMLSGVDFGTSVFDGHTSVQAIFFDRLPVGFYIHMSANHMQEDYQQRLIWDPALYETTLKAIQ
jgi:hypothetical protein